MYYSLKHIQTRETADAVRMMFFITEATRIVELQNRDHGIIPGRTQALRDDMVREQAFPRLSTMFDKFCDGLATDPAAFFKRRYDEQLLGDPATE